MQKIINELITSSVSGADAYYWKKSMWLVFTKDIRWAIELTDGGTLWYEFSFFNNLFKYVSLNKHHQYDKYIKEWANDYFFKNVDDVQWTDHPFNLGNEVCEIIDEGEKVINQKKIKNIYPDMIPGGGYDWSDEFTPELVIKHGKKM